MNFHLKLEITANDGSDTLIVRSDIPNLPPQDLSKVLTLLKEISTISYV